MKLFLISSIFDFLSMSLSSSIFVLLSWFIVPSSFSDIIFIFFPSSFISSSSFTTYFWLKSKFAIFLAIALISEIGLLNCFDIYIITIPPTIITIHAIKYKNLLDIWTLSVIDDIGSLIYTTNPLSNVPFNNIYVIFVSVSTILFISMLSSFSIIVASCFLSIPQKFMTFLILDKKSLLDIYIATFSSSLTIISKLLLIDILSSSSLILSTSICPV